MPQVRYNFGSHNLYGVSISSDVAYLELYSTCGRMEHERSLGRSGGNSYYPLHFVQNQPRREQQRGGFVLTTTRSSAASSRPSLPAPSASAWPPPA
jgi:hypothetical protein